MSTPYAAPSPPPDFRGEIRREGLGEGQAFLLRLGRGWWADDAELCTPALQGVRPQAAEALQGDRDEPGGAEFRPLAFLEEGLQEVCELVEGGDGEHLGQDGVVHRVGAGAERAALGPVAIDPGAEGGQVPRIEVFWLRRKDSIKYFNRSIDIDGGRWFGRVAFQGGHVLWKKRLGWPPWGAT